MHRLSRFALLMKGLPRGALQKLVDEEQAERYVKKFGYWQHLTAMVYAQQVGVGSLRELVAGFNQHRKHHYHLGAVEVCRSTLANANDRRKPVVFERAARLLIESARQALPRTERRHMLYLLDSTTIALRGRGSQWTKPTRTRTPGLKVHMQLDSDLQLPAAFSITAANVNDETAGRALVAIEAGCIYVFDKGYCNYSWWESIGAAGAFFVTRLKTNAAVREIECRLLEQPGGAILSDTVIELAHKSNRGGHENACTRPLRRIKVRRDNGEVIVLVSNRLDVPAQEIADLYRQRWEIELFFKWIKQHLKIKKFFGESENAVRIQLLTALIAYLLVALMKITYQLPGSLWDLAMKLKTGLFVRIEEEAEHWRRKSQREAEIRQVQRELFG